MVTPISSRGFSTYLDAAEGSDIFSIRQRLEQKELIHMKDYHYGDFDPTTQAAHILCCIFERLYDDKLEDRNFSVPRSLNQTLKLMAYNTWEKREKCGMRGDAQTDWQAGIQRFADCCFNWYHSPSEERMAA